MDTEPVPVRDLSHIGRREAFGLALTENARMVALLAALDEPDWTRPTCCSDWDVRSLASHVLAMMEAAASPREFVHLFRAGAKAAGERPRIDGMTQVQVAERTHLTSKDIVEAMADTAPRSARARYRLPAPLRYLPVPEEVDGVRETWRLGYLFDVILTRDTWMHRLDVCLATGREPDLTPEHDGRIVADVVAEWARRHGRPFHLTLEGPAGGVYAQGDGGETITAEAAEFCRVLSGRGHGTGLMAGRVPF